MIPRPETVRESKRVVKSAEILGVQGCRQWCRGAQGLGQWGGNLGMQPAVGGPFGGCGLPPQGPSRPAGSLLPWGLTHA